MTHTTNYNLNKFEATDRVTRDGFNDNADAIDAALKSVSDAAGTAQSTANAASSAAGAAQSTAATAQSTATSALEAAQAAAAAGAKIAVGSYTGTGTSSQKVAVNVGFYPKAVILSEKDSVHIQAIVTRDQEPWTGGSTITVTLLALTDAGFEVACAYNAMYTNGAGNYYYMAIG